MSTFFRNPKYESPELRDILSASKMARENWFDNLKIGHPNLTEVLQELIEYLERGDNTRFIFLIGMTGAGKTSLAKNALSDALTNLWGDADGKKMPFINVPVDTNNEHRFAWSNLYRTILRQGTAIPAECVRETLYADGILRFKNNKQLALEALKEAIASMAEHIGLKVIIFDEAYYFLRFDKVAVMDTVKSFSDKVNVKLIFIGSYELLGLAALYAIAIRRTEVVPFFRYDETNKLEMEEFATVVEKFASNWPCESIPNFPAVITELANASMGGVGQLSAILSNFLRRQIRSEEEMWTPEMFGEALKAKALEEAMREDIKRGEAELRAKYGIKNYFCTSKGIKEIGEKLAS